MTSRRRFVPVALLPWVFLAGCQSSPTGTSLGSPGGQSGSLVEITISGIGSEAVTASARTVSISTGAPGAGSAEETPRILRASAADPVRTLSRLPGDGTVQLERLSATTADIGVRGAGGYRYVSATYRVRNANLSGAAYDSPRTNLTFLAVRTAATLEGTPISRLKRFDGSDVAPVVAAQMLPTGFASVTAGGELTSASPDVLQAYTETEASSFAPPAGVSSVFPFGFVVRSEASTSNRTLAASPSVGQFDGRLTVAYRVPLQPSAAEDPYTISVMFLPVDDNRTVVTQSLEETDAPSVTALILRATSLGSEVRSFLSTSVGPLPATPVCVLRTAGTAASPTAFLANSTAYVGSLYPHPRNFIPANGSLAVSFCRPMTGATAATFVVHGFQSGKSFIGQAYSGDGTETLVTPPGSFFAGEEIEAVLTSGLQAVGGTGLAASIVTRYRVATSPASLSFTAVPDSPFPVGDLPSSVAVGDIDRDGDLDVMSANLFSDDITVLIGNGAGGFVPGSFGVGDTTNPNAVALGDVNGDGHLDLVTANSGSASVSVLLANGSGGFAPGTGSPFAVGLAPSSLALGDLDGDGDLDLVTSNSLSNNVSVMLGDGAGVFASAPSGPVAVGAYPQSIVLGDVNYDGRLDIVTANTYDDNVTVLLGNGGAGFTQAPNSPFHLGATAGPQSVALGDLDGDGYGDLVVSSTNVGEVAVLLSNGAGDFSSATGSPFTAAPGARSVVIGDLNGDGRLDVATANGSYNSVGVMLGDGAGGLAPAAGSPFPIGSLTDPYAVALGDVDGDGKLDMITANFGTNSVTVLKNN